MFISRSRVSWRINNSIISLEIIDVHGIPVKILNKMSESNSSKDLTKFESIEVVYLFGKHSEYKVLENSSCEIFNISLSSPTASTKSKVKVADEQTADLKNDITLLEKASGKTVGFLT